MSGFSHFLTSPLNFVKVLSQLLSSFSSCVAVPVADEMLACLLPGCCGLSWMMVTCCRDVLAWLPSGSLPGCVLACELKAKKGR